MKTRSILGLGGIILLAFLLTSCPQPFDLDSPDLQPLDDQLMNLQPIAYPNNLSKRIIGYYISWGMYDAHQNYYPEDIPWTKISHINYAFAEIVRSGSSYTIQGTDVWADHQIWGTGQIGKINQMKSSYGVKTLISVGGWTRSGYFSEMASTNQGRTSFANDCVRFIREYGFDGVDIDWEYPGVPRDPDPNLPGDQGNPASPEDKQNFTLLLQKLRQTLDQAGSQDGCSYLLTIAAPAGYDKVEHQEPDRYHQYLDWINIMTYDFHGGWDSYTGHLSPLYQNPDNPFPTSPVNIKETYNADYAMRLFKNTYGVPASKLNIGSPFYARSWKNVEPNDKGGLYAPGTGRPKNEGNWEFGTEGYYWVKDKESDPAYTKYYDSVAEAPYLYNAGAKLFYTYEDEQSLGTKCDYVIDNGYGGVFFWEFTGDYPASGGDHLASVIYNKFAGGGPTPTSTPTVTPTPTPGYPTWDPDTVYIKGDRVYWSGHNWEAKWWTKGEEPGTTGEWGVWKDLGPAGAPTPTPTATASPTPTATPTPTPGQDEWQSWTYYSAGTVVTYQGVSYECLQSHTSQPGWEPSTTPALWKRL